MLNFYLPVLGVVGLAVGFLGLTALQSRRFKRRNHAGVEMFPSFARMHVVRSIEAIARVCAWLAIAVGGVCLIWSVSLAN